jgi:hypothetical protein
MALDKYISLGYVTKPDPASGDQRAFKVNGDPIYVSKAPIGGTLHKWMTIPWDADYADSENMHSVNRGWTVLYNPTKTIFFDLVAHVRLKEILPGCSVHLGMYHAGPLAAGDVDGVDNVIQRADAEEFFAGPKETSNTHAFNVWKGILPAGRKMRIAVDYWNAPLGSVGWLVGGSISGFWGYSLGADEPVEPDLTV